MSPVVSGGLRWSPVVLDGLRSLQLFSWSPSVSGGLRWSPWVSVVFGGLRGLWWSPVFFVVSLSLR